MGIRSPSSPARNESLSQFAKSRIILSITFEIQWKRNCTTTQYVIIQIRAVLRYFVANSWNHTRYLFHIKVDDTQRILSWFNPLNPELNPICYLLALYGAHHFLHVSRIRVKLLIFRRLMSYIYIYVIYIYIYIYIYICGAPILDVSRSHTTTQHSR